MSNLKPKKKARTRKPKRFTWRQRHNVHTRAKRPQITPFNEPEHAISYPVKPVSWTLAEANERVLDIYKD